MNGRHTQNDPNYVDKNVRVQRKIGANFSISKSPKTIGLDADVQGTLTTTREETYKDNKIPSVLALVNREDREDREDREIQTDE